jgi:hypothetical protein
MSAAVPYLEMLGNAALACPHPQPLSQAWEKGARAGGEGRMQSFRVIAKEISTNLIWCQSLEPNGFLPPEEFPPIPLRFGVELLRS